MFHEKSKQLKTTHSKHVNFRLSPFVVPRWTHEVSHSHGSFPSNRAWKIIFWLFFFQHAWLKKSLKRRWDDEKVVLKHTTRVSEWETEGRGRERGKLKTTNSSRHFILFLFNDFSVLRASIGIFLLHGVTDDTCSYMFSQCLKLFQSFVRIVAKNKGAA